MRVPDLLPPRSNFPASMSGPSLLSLPLAESEVDCPMFTEDDDEYRALMLAEFGPLVPVLSQDQAQAMIMLAADDDKEIQSEAPGLLSEDEDELQMMTGDENEMQACPPIPPCPDNKEGRKKRKKPPPLPSTEETFDEPNPRRCKRAKEEIEELPSPRATNKMMATCLLKRRHSAPEPSKQTIIWCQCEELPRDCPGCPLHQHAPFRSWMLELGDGEIPAAGSGDGVVVPKTRNESKKTVLRYIRWRSKVWMPSRFYVEQARPE